MLCPIYEEKQKRIGGNAKIDKLEGCRAISRKPNFALSAAARFDRGVQAPNLFGNVAS